MVWLSTIKHVGKISQRSLGHLKGQMEPKARNPKLASGHLKVEPKQATKRHKHDSNSNLNLSVMLIRRLQSEFKQFRHANQSSTNLEMLVRRPESEFRRPESEFRRLESEFNQFRNASQKA